VDLQLSGKLALISGSTAGIGFAIATELAREGVKIVLNGRRPQQVAEAVERLRQLVSGAEIDGVAADLATADGVAALIAGCPQADILVNNLGIFDPVPFESIPDSEWQRFFEINVMSGVRLSRHYLPLMKAANWGRIVFISSESGINPPTEMLHYGMTKAAQLSISRGLAQTTTGTGVTVNAVLPGPTRSEGVAEFLGKLAGEQGITHARLGHQWRRLAGRGRRCFFHVLIFSQLSRRPTDEKNKVCVDRPGNIGTDLLYKLQRSPFLEPVWMVGIDPESEGLKRAAEMGLKVTADGVDGLLPHVLADGVQIAFDATSAYVHAENSRKLNALGVLMIDLTPAAIGPFCVPPVNLKELVGRREMNVNMVTCGGQATIPMVAAISRVQKVKYGEIVATISSKSAGPGTRKNIDEFTRTTSGAIEKVGGAEKGKAIIIINPAEPPLIMRDTVHCLTEEEPQTRGAITESIHAMIKEVQKYVPGYRLVNGPVFDGNRVSVFLEVQGLGDFLPTYAGNLDIMTAAAARTAEMFAEEIINGTLKLEPAAA
jgi:acetaldehyde/propanal dehydrogenase